MQGHQFWPYPVRQSPPFQRLVPLILQAWSILSLNLFSDSVQGRETNPEITTFEVMFVTLCGVIHCVTHCVRLLMLLQDELRLFIMFSDGEQVLYCHSHQAIERYSMAKAHWPSESMLTIEQACGFPPCHIFLTHPKHVWGLVN